MIARLILTTALVGANLALAGCGVGSSGRSRAPKEHVYVPVEGQVTILHEGRRAFAPRRAPRIVHHCVHVGNTLQGKPYRRGGGHSRVDDSGYDCSGAVSHVLIKTGLLDSPLPSKAFKKWGQPGRGKWITVYAKSDHSFITLGGLRLDTGWVRDGDERGPRWKTRTRPTNGYVMRHPRGL
jgi:hypothetical protein